MKKNQGLNFLIIMSIIIPIVLAVAILIIMPKLFFISIILVIISIVIVSTITGKHNLMVRYKNKVKEAFALIDVQLKLRFDLYYHTST